MAFDVLPGLSGPLPIAGQQTSQLFDLKVPPGEKKIFLRLVALFQDNDPLGGAAPTLQIKAGMGGVIASVDADAPAVGVRNVDNKVVGTATCERLPNDIFLLTISDIAENSGPWELRIRNNDSESLRFLGFIALNADDTRQPWLVVGGPDDPPPGETFFRLRNEGSRDIEIRNLGTAPLVISQDPGPLGEDDSVRLTQKPNRIGLHGLGKLRFECDDHASGRVIHFLRCNDTIKDHTKVDLLVTRTPHTHSNPDGGGLGSIHPM